MAAKSFIDDDDDDDDDVGGGGGDGGGGGGGGESVGLIGVARIELTAAAEHTPFAFG